MVEELNDSDTYLSLTSIRSYIRSLEISSYDREDLLRTTHLPESVTCTTSAHGL